MGDTFSNIGPGSHITSWSTVTDEELDERIAHGGREILNNKRIVQEIKAYLADHAEDILTDGEKAVLTDIATIIDG